ncbi:MAG: hypothetical protein ABIP85_03670 [Chthoniobacteraceae bacterium]
MLASLEFFCSAPSVAPHFMGGQGSVFGFNLAQTFRFPLGASRWPGHFLGAPPSADFSPFPSGRSNGQHPQSLDTLLSREKQLARALTMRVYDAKIVYSLVSLGDEIHLDRP